MNFKLSDLRSRANNFLLQNIEKPDAIKHKGSNTMDKSRRNKKNNHRN